MHVAILVLTYLVCASHGRRVQTAVEQLKSFLDMTAHSEADGVARPDHKSHLEKTVPNTESGAQSWRTYSSPTQINFENPMESLMREWNSLKSTLGAFHRQSEQSNWSMNSYWPLSAVGGVSAFIFILCCSFWVKKRTTPGKKMRNKRTNSPGETPRDDENASGAIWQAGCSSLPVLSARLEAWDACQDTEPASFAIPAAQKLLAPEDHGSSETVDTANIEDTGVISDSGETCYSNITEDVAVPVTFEPNGISPTLLNYAIAKRLLKYLPAGPRVPGATVWKLQYKPVAHGTSMATLHRMASGCKRSLLLIRDADDHVFGGFAPSPWKLGGRFHGSGEAFVFTFGRVANRSADAEAEEEAQAPIDLEEVKVFPWTKSNEYFMFASQSLLAMGGGDGRHALAIHEGLLRGHSSPTPTFGNPPLCAVQGGDFVLKDMELWSLE